MIGGVLSGVGPGTSQSNARGCRRNPQPQESSTTNTNPKRDALLKVSISGGTPGSKVVNCYEGWEARSWGSGNGVVSILA